MASMTPTGRPRVNAGKMWMGGLMAGVVAAGVALVGLWIVGLATAVAVLTPFTTDAFVSAKIATALLNLAIGLTILTLVSSVGRSATYSVGEPHSHGMTTERLPYREP